MKCYFAKSIYVFVAALSLPGKCCGKRAELADQADSHGGSFSPGGTTDILARAIGDKLTQSLGQQVVVDNRPGAGGNIGADIVAKSTDGHTFVMGTVGTHAINASLTRGPKSTDETSAYAPLKFA